MKNLLKKPALMAFVFGLGLMLTVVSMSSFKGETRAERYYYYDNQWHDTPSETLTCQPLDPTKICSAVFEEMPTTDNSVSSNPTAVAATLGIVQ